MADVEISYSGNVIASLSASGTKTLLTSGKYCEDDITVEYVSPGGGVSISPMDHPVTIQNGTSSTKACGYVEYNATVIISATSGNLASNASVTKTSMATDGTHFWVRANNTSSISYNGSPATFSKSGNDYMVTIPTGFDGTIPFIIT